MATLPWVGALDVALDLADRLPSNMTGAVAAVDFVSNLDRPDDTPANWTGLKSLNDFIASLGHVEEFIDGEPRPVEPEWDGLPFNDNLTLSLLALIRRESEATMEQLKQVAPGRRAATVRRCLVLAEVDGWVQRTGPERTSLWKRTDKILETFPAGTWFYCPAKPKPSKDNLPADQLLAE